MSDKCPRCNATLNFIEAEDGQSVSISCPACGWTPALSKFVGYMEVTPELLRDADHSKFDIWKAAAPYDAVADTVSVHALRVPTRNQRREDSITVVVIGWAEKKETDFDDLRAVITCPECGTEQEDHDGFSVLFCPACGYCAHSSRTGDICDICGKRVTTCQRCQGSGVLRGIEVGFGGVDQGAECGDCEGAGIMVEGGIR